MAMWNRPRLVVFRSSSDPTNKMPPPSSDYSAICSVNLIIIHQAINFKSDAVFGFNYFNLVFSKIQYMRYLQQVHLQLSIPIGEEDLLLELIVLLFGYLLDYYSVLGVSKNASKEDIKSADGRLAPASRCIVSPGGVKDD
ncbi:hypothetical protein C5167_008174 [Papaver somniferum]|uniref:Uncharacterized protein n=1 Tax=Papaver somniferum TaxID=3469 RepID=A0A4Y7JWS2_PAPSO|nr:hypothetical protein C5167_008174 [Papaver somniferum]